MTLPIIQQQVVQTEIEYLPSNNERLVTEINLHSPSLLDTEPVNHNQGEYRVSAFTGLNDHIQESIGPQLSIETGNNNEAIETILKPSINPVTGVGGLLLQHNIAPTTATQSLWRNDQPDSLTDSYALPCYPPRADCCRE